MPNGKLLESKIRTTHECLVDKGGVVFAGAVVVAVLMRAVVDEDMHAQIDAKTNEQSSGYIAYPLLNRVEFVGERID